MRPLTLEGTRPKSRPLGRTPRLGYDNEQRVRRALSTFKLASSRDLVRATKLPRSTLFKTLRKLQDQGTLGKTDVGLYYLFDDLPMFRFLAAIGLRVFPRSDDPVAAIADLVQRRTCCGKLIDSKMPQCPTCGAWHVRPAWEVATDVTDADPIRALASIWIGDSQSKAAKAQPASRE